MTLTAVKGIIERSLSATNRGKFVLDLRVPTTSLGNDWLRNAAIQLPQNRVDARRDNPSRLGSDRCYRIRQWGSNDRHHNRRFTMGLHWLPGGIVTEYVSTDARTFKKPPEKWIPTPGVEQFRLLVREFAAVDAGGLYPRRGTPEARDTSTNPT